VGWPDEFIEHGKVNILREKHHITAQALVEKTLQHLENQQNADETASAKLVENSSNRLSA
jgi:predicted NAD-dependent protein-ADP-ribosyltransferase YbiA (DUF1768 family)